VITDTNNGIWKRVNILPFENKINEEDKVPDLDKKFIKDEAAGILNWLIKGCLLYQKEGLQPTEKMVNEKTDYQTEQDVFGRFISDCCVVAPHCEVITTELYKCYQEWCAENSEKPLSNGYFGRELKSRGFNSIRSKKPYKYIGIGSKSNDEPPAKLNGNGSVIFVARDSYTETRLVSLIGEDALCVGLETKTIIMNGSKFQVIGDVEIETSSGTFN